MVFKVFRLTIRRQRHPRNKWGKWCKVVQSPEFETSTTAADSTKQETKYYRISIKYRIYEFCIGRWKYYQTDNNYNNNAVSFNFQDILIMRAFVKVKCVGVIYFQNACDTRAMHGTWQVSVSILVLRNLYTFTAEIESFGISKWCLLIVSVYKV